MVEEEEVGRGKLGGGRTGDGMYMYRESLLDIFSSDLDFSSPPFTKFVLNMCIYKP
jgi:hypothetical protein